MKKALLLIILVLLVTSCTKAQGRESEEPDSGISDISSATVIVMYEDIDFLTLIPAIGEIEEQTDTTAKIIKFEEEEFFDYLSDLKNDGWECIVSVIELEDESEHINGPFILIKGNTVLSIGLRLTTMQYVDSDYNYLTMRFEEGSKYSSYPGRTSKEDAITAIQRVIDLNPDYDRTVYRVVEREMDELFEKTGMQVFNAYSETQCMSQYLVCGESAMIAFYSLDRTVIADIDNDGVYELLGIFDMYSGRSGFSVYTIKYGIPPDSDSDKKQLYIPYSSSYGFVGGISVFPGVLTFDKKNENEVYLKSSGMKDGDWGLLKFEDGRMFTDLIAEYEDLRHE